MEVFNTTVVTREMYQQIFGFLLWWLLASWFVLTSLFVISRKGLGLGGAISQLAHMVSTESAAGNAAQKKKKKKKNDKKKKKKKKKNDDDE